VRRLAFVASAAAIAAALAACGGGEADPASPPQPAPATAGTDAAGTGAAGTGGQAGKVGPRRGGFEVALGEWALTPEAESIRPGRVVFVITNRGTMPHGFEIGREDGDDSSGSGSGEDGDKVETRVLQPGETVRVDLNLEAGVYKLECNVEGHDDMGMEMLMEVRRDAPLEAKPATAAAKQTAAVAIEAFTFAPPTITAKVGQKVTWRNHDPAEHTVTAEDGSFDSGTMAQNGTFKAALDQPGEYRYSCALHPGMKGTVVVRR
jgi:plastocyanin